MEAYNKMLLSTDKKRLDEVKDYILNHIGEDLSLQALSERFAYSSITLRRQFFLLFRQSLSKFVLSTRMNKAYELIKENEVPVSLVGALVGYKDRSAFSHAFSKYYGQPPNQLRHYDDIIQTKILNYLN